MSDIEFEINALEIRPDSEIAGTISVSDLGLKRAHNLQVIQQKGNLAKRRKAVHTAGYHA